MTIYERIKLKRKELGLSADEVAKALGISRATVYRYESSEVEKLPITILEPLARVLKTTPSYLMGWEVNEPIHDKEKDLLLDRFDQLNTLGKSKAIDYVSDLADNPRYNANEVQEKIVPYIPEAAAAHHKTGVYTEADYRDIEKMKEIARKINQKDL